MQYLENPWGNAKCLFVMVSVLRGTISSGNIGTPEQDFNEIREHLITGRRGESHKVLTKVVAESSNNKTPLTMKGEVEEPEVERDPSVPYSFDPKIFDWDDQRSQGILENPAFPDFFVLFLLGGHP